MRSSSKSSRQRYLQYRRELKSRERAPKKSSGQPGTPGTNAPAPAAEPGVAAPSTRHKLQRSFFVLLRAFWAMMPSHQRMMAFSLATLTISVTLGLIPPYGMKLVFDTALGGRPLPQHIPSWLHIPTDPHWLLAYVAIGSVLIALVSQLISLWGRWQATRITKLLQISVRKKIFEHAVRLPLHRVYDLKSGGAPSLIREDAGAVGELIFGMLYNPWRAITQLLGILTILAFTNWKLLAGSLVIIPAVWLSHRTWINQIRPIFSDIRATRTRTDAHATEAFSGIRVVRGFARQHGESARFTRNQDLMARQEILSWWWMRVIEMVWALLIPTAIALLIYFGGSIVLHDRALIAEGLLKQEQAFTIGDLMMFLFYLGMLLGPLEALANSATQFQNSLAGLDRVLNVLAEPTEMNTKPGSRVLSRDTPPARITLRGVGFSYPNATQHVLEGINLDAEPGEMIALIGPSGAGKTTLCNLIARFYDPTAGSIRFDGVDLRDIDVDSYRSLLGIVEQDTFLFDGTVADNIAYGRRHATMDEIIVAAKQANAHEFIAALPKGYQSIIGERGVKLSGGQRQRLTIARAILADPRILILDEATSNLDTESERLIQHSLAALMSGRTSFVIAHRLSTIAHAHRIVVLEHGRIVETGRHDELMSRSGRYRQMVELQTSPTVSPTVDVSDAVA